MQFSAIVRWRKPPCARRLQEQSVHPVGTPMPCGIAGVPTIDPTTCKPSAERLSVKVFAKRDAPRQCGLEPMRWIRKGFAPQPQEPTHGPRTNLSRIAPQWSPSLCKGTTKGAQARCRTRTENFENRFSSCYHFLSLGRQFHHVLLTDAEAVFDLSGHSALVHNDYAVAHAQNFRKLRTNHQNGLPLLGQSMNELVDFELRSNADPPRWFVKDNDLGISLEPFGKNNLLLISSDKVPAT